MVSLVAQMVKSLPAMRETRVQSLGWEDPLEKEMATYSNTLAWKIPWMAEPSRLQSRVAKSRTGPSKLTFTFMYVFSFCSGLVSVAPASGVFPPGAGPSV